MLHLSIIRQVNKIDKRIRKIENSVKFELEDIDREVNNYKETDPFDQFVELVMLFATSFKLILLGSALFIPWSSIRDFWVKLSMGIFLVKSSKRIRKTLKKVFKRKQDEDSEGVSVNENEKKIK